jgi:CheY-like chemotaxis protein
MHMPGMDGLTLARAFKADPAIAAVRLVLLTSVGLYGNTHEAQQAGIALCLSKPIRQSQLYDSLATMLGTPAAPATPQESHPDQTSAPALLHGHVLLAADNPVHQAVAASMLECLGYRASVVSNGQEAVDALAQATSDLYQFSLVFVHPTTRHVAERWDTTAGCTAICRMWY